MNCASVHISVASLDQNVLFIFVNNMYIANIRKVSHIKRLYMKT